MSRPLEVTGDDATDPPPEELEKEHAAAAEEWDGSEDAKLWETTIADGIDY